MLQFPQNLTQKKKYSYHVTYHVTPKSFEQFLSNLTECYHPNSSFCPSESTGDKDPHCANERRRPPVPKATDHIATPYRTRRNFVHKNALDAMLSEPPGNAKDSGDADSSDACYVDSPRGNTQVRAALHDKIGLY